MTAHTTTDREAHLRRSLRRLGYDLRPGAPTSTSGARAPRSTRCRTCSASISVTSRPGSGSGRKGSSGRRAHRR
jgi:hypothetical protein